MFLRNQIAEKVNYLTVSHLAEIKSFGLRINTYLFPYLYG